MQGLAAVQRICQGRLRRWLLRGSGNAQDVPVPGRESLVLSQGRHRDFQRGHDVLRPKRAAQARLLQERRGATRLSATRPADLERGRHRLASSALQGNLPGLRMRMCRFPDGQKVETDLKRQDLRGSLLPAGRPAWQSSPADRASPRQGLNRQFIPRHGRRSAARMIPRLRPAFRRR